ncbi:hypothetical protein ACHAXT_010562 [Thalassiosira profunda]
MRRASEHTENTPLVGLRFVGDDRNDDTHQHQTTRTERAIERRRSALWALFMSGACVTAICVLKFANHGPLFTSSEYEEAAEIESVLERLGRGRSKKANKSPYERVQTLSFQIYTGGAPAFIADESTGEEKRNPECEGFELHSYGLPEDSEEYQCYLGLEDTTEDVRHRLAIMRDAVNRAYDKSDQDKSTLKIFLAPEFFFRGSDGAFSFVLEEEKEAEGECSDICHILKGLEDIAADERFENWLFLFGTVIASEALPVEDTFDFQFYNFAPMYKGFDPAKVSIKNKKAGKNFIVPKRYVSNIDFMTPMRDLTNRTLVMELLDEKDRTLDRTLMNPHASGQHRYDNDVWMRYKDELSGLGYTMIEYGWFYLDGISFAVEICLDHLQRRALMTHTADLVTGQNTLVPSSANDSIEWIGLPKRQAQLQLISSAGMDVEVSSMALADGGHVFLQDGAEGHVPPSTTYGEDECKPNEYEFHGGSQSIKRTAVISATDVTFNYEMNYDFKDYNLYTERGRRHWKDALRGVFSSAMYPPRLTVYDPVPITDNGGE